MKIGEKLPDFPVVRADRTTTKTRIAFDASAKFRGKSLNSEALPGPQLQADMFSIQVRFRKEFVALVGDVSQMYHQLVLTLEDRPLHTNKGGKSLKKLWCCVGGSVTR